MPAQDCDPIRLKCPQCGRFLGDVREYGRLVCSACGSEVTYRSREERRRGLTTPGRFGIVEIAT